MLLNVHCFNTFSWHSLRHFLVRTSSKRKILILGSVSTAANQLSNAGGLSRKNNVNGPTLLASCSWRSSSVNREGSIMEPLQTSNVRSESWFRNKMHKVLFLL